MKTSVKRALVFFAFVQLSSCSTPNESKNKEVNPDNTFVIEWNYLAYQLAYEHDQFYSFIGIRTLTMTHLAMHDALNAIKPKFEQYAYTGQMPEADPLIAASVAASEVLINAYPKRQDTIVLVLNKWLDSANDSPSKKTGIKLGSATAQAIIALRQGDGHQKQGDYTPMTKPGDYQYTPGWDGWVLKPDFDYAKPFALDTVTQFRSPPPPKLSSEEYARSYQEVKDYGRKENALRTKDQTHIAHWWAEFAEHSWNRIGRITAEKNQLDPWSTARMFALINMDIYDIYLASLESKYHYDTWRPYTAIRSTHDDGNPLTEPDHDWEPEMLTPPWPEYPSAHAAVGAGGAEIVSHVFGREDIHFSMESTSALPIAKVRSYENLKKAAEDCANSRIMNGYHFRFATEEGKQQGKQIAQYIYSNYLRPVKG